MLVRTHSNSRPYRQYRVGKEFFSRTTCTGLQLLPLGGLESLAFIFWRFGREYRASCLDGVEFAGKALPLRARSLPLPLRPVVVVIVVDWPDCGFRIAADLDADQPCAATRRMIWPIFRTILLQKKKRQTCGTRGRCLGSLAG